MTQAIIMSLTLVERIKMFVGVRRVSKSVSMIYAAFSGQYIIEFWQSQLATQTLAEKKWKLLFAQKKPLKISNKSEARND